MLTPTHPPTNKISPSVQIGLFVRYLNIIYQCARTYARTQRVSHRTMWLWCALCRMPCMRVCNWIEFVAVLIANIVSKAYKRHRLNRDWTQTMYSFRSWFVASEGLSSQNVVQRLYHYINQHIFLLNRNLTLLSSSSSPLSSPDSCSQSPHSFGHVVHPK